MGRKKINIEQTEDGKAIISGTAGDILDTLKSAANGTRDKPIVITSAALKDLFCHYSYDHTIAPGIVNSAKIRSELPVHDDMKEAFGVIGIHLAAICEELSETQMQEFQSDDPSVFGIADAFSVSAFRIVGVGEDRGVVLIGEKKLSTEEIVKLETPVTKYEGSYALVNELHIAIDNCVKEVEEYMKGKQAPAYVQQNMFEEEPSNTEEGI